MWIQPLGDKDWEKAGEGVFKYSVLDHEHTHGISQENSSCFDEKKEKASAI